jgi:hypothetical protein
MCKEFQEVDPFAASTLMEFIKEPSKTPIPRLNPFSPVVVGDEIYQDVQIIHQTIQYLRNPGSFNIRSDQLTGSYQDDKSESVQRSKKIRKQEHPPGRHEQQDLYHKRRQRKDSFSSSD